MATRTYDCAIADRFTFRMRAYAAAHFEWGHVLTVTWPTGEEAELTSEHTGGDDGRAYAVTIHGEIRGSCESIDDAEIRLPRMVGNTLPLLALASNAAIADPLAVATYGLDLAEPRPFVGYRTPDATEWFPPGRRWIDVEATGTLLSAVGQHPHADLLQRAIESYRRALGQWTPETRLLAGEFLYIAGETLTRFMIESRAAAQGMTPKNLAKLNGIAGPDALRSRYLRDEIFDGDSEAFDGMEEASNAFEHGYMSVDEVRGLLEPVLERSMGYVRRALVTEAGIDPEMRSRLLSADYAEPRGLVPPIPFVRGELTRVDPDQPPPQMDETTVELDWAASTPVATRSPEGEVTIEFSHNVEVREMPPNATLNLSEWGMRAAHMRLAGDEPLRVEVRRAGQDT